MQIYLQLVTLEILKLPKKYMKENLLDLSGKIERPTVSIYEIISEVADTLNIPFFVVDASATRGFSGLGAAFLPGIITNTGVRRISMILRWNINIEWNRVTKIVGALGRERYQDLSCGDKQLTSAWQTVPQIVMGWYIYDISTCQRLTYMLGLKC